MIDDFQLEDLLFQDDFRVVFRAKGPDGVACRITRLKLPYEVLQALSLTRFARSIVELKSLEMSCLRAVIDGGLDQVDNAPWIATLDWPGETLSHRLDTGNFKTDDATRLDNHGKATIKFLDDTVEMPGALSFDPRDIILTKSDNGEAVETFCIDYHRWFVDWSSGKKIGHSVDPHAMLNHLVQSAAPPTEPAPNEPPPEANTPDAPPASRLLTPGAPVKVPAKLVKQKTTGAQGRLAPRLVVPGKTPPANGQPEPDTPPPAQPAPQPQQQAPAAQQSPAPAAQENPPPQQQPPAPQPTQPVAVVQPTPHPQPAASVPLPEAPAEPVTVPQPAGTAIPAQIPILKEEPPAVTTTPVPPASTPLPTGPVPTKNGAIKLKVGGLNPPVRSGPIASAPMGSSPMLPNAGSPGLASQASVIGGAAAVSAASPVNQPLASPPKANQTPLIIGLLIALLGLGGGAFFALSGKKDPTPAVAEASTTEAAPAKVAPAPKPKPATLARKKTAPRIAPPPPEVKIDDNRAFFTKNDYDKLKAIDGVKATIRGKVQEVKRHGQNLYLKFKVAKPQVAAGVERVAENDFFLESEMKEYLNRTIEVTGAVKVEGNGRATIFFSEPGSIKEISPEMAIPREE